MNASRAPLLLLLAVGILASGRAQEALPVLRTARAVRELSAREADRAWPAEISGVVLGLAEPENAALVMRDETDSIYLVGPRASVGALQPGDYITVRGHSDAGGFAPFLKAEDIRKIGACSVPEPTRISSEDLFTKGLDAQWIVVTGLVREVRELRPDEIPRGHELLERGPPGGDEHGRRIKMTLAVGDRLVPVQLHGPLDAGKLVDAEVEIRGLCFNQHNAERQFLNPLILVPRGVDIRVLRPAEAGPFDGPAIAPRSLFQFRREGLSTRRVHIDGVVLHQVFGTGIWIRNAECGIFVQTEQRTRLEPGDLVRVAGFPERGAFSPILAHAVFQKVDRGPEPRPTLLASRESAARHTDDLVVIEGLLVDQKETADGLLLRLDWRGTDIAAVWSRGDEGVAAHAFETGSLLSVAGICVVSSARGRPLSGLLVPDNYSLLVRKGGDLAVLRVAPWWTGRRVATLLLTVVALLVAILATVFIASRRKIAKERALRALKVSEYTARLAERTRMARDLHDSVAQGLGAISLQLELASPNLASGNGAVARHLSQAQQLVRSSMVEVRCFIRNLRTQTQQDVELAAALEELLRAAVEGSSIKPEFSADGAVYHLSSAIESQIIQIAQEAVSNAVRHSGGHMLALRLHYSTSALEVAIADDGVGFDHTADWGERLHFGLMGMKERAALVSAELTIEAPAGKGTLVHLRVPRTAVVRDSVSL